MQLNKELTKRNVDEKRKLILLQLVENSILSNKSKNQLKNEIVGGKIKNKHMLNLRMEEISKYDKKIKKEEEFKQRQKIIRRHNKKNIGEQEIKKRDLKFHLLHIVLSAQLPINLKKIIEKEIRYQKIKDEPTLLKRIEEIEKEEREKNKTQSYGKGRIYPPTKSSGPEPYSGYGSNYWSDLYH